MRVFKLVAGCVLSGVALERLVHLSVLMIERREPPLVYVAVYMFCGVAAVLISQLLLLIAFKEIDRDD